jgi:hypothetical protein
MVVSGTNSPALAAAGLTPGRLYLNDETSLSQIDTGNEKIGNSDQNSGKLGYAHGFPFLSEVFVNIRKNGKSCVFIYTGNESRKFRRAFGQTAATGSRLPTLDAGEPDKTARKSLTQLCLPDICPSLMIGPKIRMC